MSAKCFFLIRCNETEIGCNPVCNHLFPIVTECSAYLLMPFFHRIRKVSPSIKACHRQILKPHQPRKEEQTVSFHYEDEYLPVNQKQQNRNEQNQNQNKQRQQEQKKRQNQQQNRNEF